MSSDRYYFKAEFKYGLLVIRDSLHNYDADSARNGDHDSGRGIWESEQRVSPVNSYRVTAARFSVKTGADYWQTGSARTTITHLNLARLQLRAGPC